MKINRYLAMFAGIMILILIVITKVGNKKSRSMTTFKNESTISNITLNKIEFEDITKKYENGITTINANVYNNTSEVKDIIVKIVLEDEDKNVVDDIEFEM